MDSLVSTQWLAEHLVDDDLVLLDCTVHTLVDEQGKFVGNESGRAGYEAGHIPAAGFADLKGELCDNSQSIEFAVPSPEQFCKAMGELGVGDDSRVVLYDSMMSAWAARVWWMLRWVGFDNAALLDGVLSAWQAEDRLLETGPVARPAKTLTPKPQPRLIADRDEVFAAIDNEQVKLIDTLPPAMYRGERQSMYGRPGHIPGAVNICAIDLLDESGRFRSQAELAQLFASDRNARTITYCGGGIMASVDAFIMTRLGFSDVAVYTASLQEWAADPANPLVTGDDPG